MQVAIRTPRMADLDSGSIAAAALALLDKTGLDGFTMRGVADVLGVTPMALYHHVKDKAALAALVVDAATREHALPAPTGDWREDMFAIARWSREATLARPAVGRLRAAYQIWTPSILQITERWVGLWQQSGLPLETAVRAAAMSSQAIVGLVEQELALSRMPPPDEALLALLPNVRLAFTAPRDPDQAFEILVRLVIDGLHAKLAG